MGRTVVTCTHRDALFVLGLADLDLVVPGENE